MWIFVDQTMEDGVVLELPRTLTKGRQSLQLERAAAIVLCVLANRAYQSPAHGTPREQLQSELAIHGFLAREVYGPINEIKCAFAHFRSGICVKYARKRQGPGYWLDARIVVPDYDEARVSRSMERFFGECWRSIVPPRKLK